MKHGELDREAFIFPKTLAVGHEVRCVAENVENPDANGLRLSPRDCRKTNDGGGHARCGATQDVYTSKSMPHLHILKLKNAPMPGSFVSRGKPHPRGLHESPVSIE